MIITVWYGTFIYKLIIYFISLQGTKSSLIQDLFIKKIPEVKSSVSEVECYICGKGIRDGYRIAAKTLPNGMALFCDVHYSLQCLED